MRGSSSTTRMVATATILGADIRSDRTGVGGWRRWCSAFRRRLLAVLPAVPLARPVLERPWAVAPAALVPVPTAAHHPAGSKTPERHAEQPEQAEQDQQEPQDSKTAEERVEAVAVVVGRCVRRAFRQMR